MIMTVTQILKLNSRLVEGVTSKGIPHIILVPDNAKIKRGAMLHVRRRLNLYVAQDWEGKTL